VSEIYETIVWGCADNFRQLWNVEKVDGGVNLILQVRLSEALIERMNIEYSIVYYLDHLQIANYKHFLFAALFVDQTRQYNNKCIDIQGFLNNTDTIVWLW
jgi:hypothetical protein